MSHNKHNHNHDQIQKTSNEEQKLSTFGKLTNACEPLDRKSVSEESVLPKDELMDPLDQVDENQKSCTPSHYLLETDKTWDNIPQHGSSNHRLSDKCHVVVQEHNQGQETYKKVQNKLASNARLPLALEPLEGKSKSEELMMLKKEVIDLLDKSDDSLKSRPLSHYSLEKDYPCEKIPQKGSLNQPPPDMHHVSIAEHDQGQVTNIEVENVTSSDACARFGRVVYVEPFERESVSNKLVDPETGLLVDEEEVIDLSEEEGSIQESSHDTQHLPEVERVHKKQEISNLQQVLHECARRHGRRRAAILSQVSGMTSPR